MPNNLEKSQKYLSLILELFNKGSLTARLDSASFQYDNTDAKIVKVLTVDTTGMGTYDRDTGYPKGSITATWIPFELNCDRGAKFLLDRIDDDEVLGLTIGAAAKNFTERHMIPELDAYRLSKYADGAGKQEDDTLSAETILDAIDRAAVYLNEKNVPDTGRILYVNQSLELHLRKALSRQWSNDAVINTRVTNYNGMEILYVPSSRFYSEVTLNSGAGDQWGYAKADAAVGVNFLLLYPQSVIQASKTARGKFITADDNPNLDSHEFHFRIFHDAKVIEPLKDGVYAHMAED
jgi:hypothetical protein